MTSIAFSAVSPVSPNACRAAVAVRPISVMSPSPTADAFDACSKMDIASAPRAPPDVIANMARARSAGVCPTSVDRPFMLSAYWSIWSACNPTRVFSFISSVWNSLAAAMPSPIALPVKIASAAAASLLAPANAPRPAVPAAIADTNPPVLAVTFAAIGKMVILVSRPFRSASLPLLRLLPHSTTSTISGPR